jgi:DNA polymerase elongation subunit (family B)
MGKIESIRKLPRLEDTDKKPIIYADTDSVYIDFSVIMSSIGYNYESSLEESVKNFIIFNDERSNSELGIDYAEREEGEELSDDEKAEMIAKAADMEENADSIQNYVGGLINNAMKQLSVKCFNCKENKISFKREAVASRGIFMSKKKRYVLWALNNEGVELPEKKRFKVTGGDLVSSTTPPIVKSGMRQVIIDVLKYVDMERSIEQLRDMHDKFWEANPDQIAFSKFMMVIKCRTCMLRLVQIGNPML